MSSVLAAFYSDWLLKKYLKLCCIRGSGGKPTHHMACNVDGAPLLIVLNHNSQTILAAARKDLPFPG